MLALLLKYGFWAGAAVLAIVVGHFLYQVSKLGLGWGIGQMGVLMQKARTRLQSARSIASTLKGDLAAHSAAIAALQADMKAVKAKLGL